MEPTIFSIYTLFWKGKNDKMGGRKKGILSRQIEIFGGKKVHRGPVCLCIPHTFTKLYIHFSKIKTLKGEWLEEHRSSYQTKHKSAQPQN